MGRSGHSRIRPIARLDLLWAQIWRAYKPWLGWQPYDGSNPHTNHVHFSFSWAGADQQTSFWTDEPIVGGDEDQPECVPAPHPDATDEYFKDLPPTATGYTAALALAQAGITNGCSNEPKLFCPSCPATRYGRPPRSRAGGRRIGPHARAHRRSKRAMGRIRLHARP